VIEADAMPFGNTVTAALGEKVTCLNAYSDPLLSMVRRRGTPARLATVRIPVVLSYCTVTGVLFLAAAANAYSSCVATCTAPRRARSCCSVVFTAGNAT